MGYKKILTIVIPENNKRKLNGSMVRKPALFTKSRKDMFTFNHTDGAHMNSKP